MPARAYMVTVRISFLLYRPEGEVLIARRYLANGEFEMRVDMMKDASDTRNVDAYAQLDKGR